MKDRVSFVSNSSSSSFIVHKSLIGTENFNKLVDYLNKIEDETRDELGDWGDRGGTFERNGDWLYVETYYVSSVVEDFHVMLESLGCKGDNTFYIYR